MNTVFIYALKEPDTEKIRYIGKTSNIKTRIHRHVHEARHNKNSCHRLCWIRLLLSKKLKPILEILDEVPEKQWAFFEKAYIKIYRELGFDLVNTTDGGDSGPRMTGENHPNYGKKFSIARCNKMRLASLGKKASDSARANMSRAQLQRAEKQRQADVLDEMWS